MPSTQSSWVLKRIQAPSTATVSPSNGAAVAPKKRKPTRPTLASKHRRLESKVKRGRIKALRAKVLD